jgi:polysaccharide pyruvyl transferase WcaK-like protein
MKKVCPANFQAQANQVIEILHVASFDGNVGDNASHSGLYKTLSKNTGWTLKVTEREIRKAYLNYDGSDKWEWDSTFIGQVNAHDLTIVGGGNYFELWIEGSATGTTVDMEVALLEKLERPMVFHGIGFDPCKGYTSATVDKFKTFLDAVSRHPLCLVAFRNDGSAAHLQRLLGDTAGNGVMKTPDPGFFIDIANAKTSAIVSPSYWAVNIAADMACVRFPGGPDFVDYPGFISNMRDLAVVSLQKYPGLEWVLVPHIYSDLKAISDFMEALPEYIRRNRITVAPLQHGPEAHLHTFSTYANAQLVIGTRFHTNVCSIGLGVPTVGLVTYAKLASLYEELGMPERAVWANKCDFISKVVPLLDATMKGLPKVGHMYTQKRQDLEQQCQRVHAKIKALVFAS